jgi:hypothetical protein
LGAAQSKNVDSCGEAQNAGDEVGIDH